MIKENKLIHRTVKALSNGLIPLTGKKAKVLSWKVSPDKEGAMNFMKRENEFFKKEMYLWCHLMSNPLNVEKTQYQFQVMPVIYSPCSETEILELYLACYYVLNLSKSVEWDDFEKNIKKSNLLPVIKHALQTFKKDHEELKNDYEPLKSISFSFPPDNILIKCIDHRSKKKPWEYKCGL